MPRVKHHFEPGHVYHLTTRTRTGEFAFESETAKRMIADALGFYRGRGDWILYAFVIMANHVHCVAGETGIGLNRVFGAFKSWVSNRLGTETQGTRLERRFDDNAVRDWREMVSVVAYVHENPVRIGLVRGPEDYFWSSARNYAGLSPVAIEVDLAW